MKTKSLVLGAHPPFEGPWVSLKGEEEWIVVIESKPYHKDAAQAVSFDFNLTGDLEEDKNLYIEGELKRASSVRVRVKYINGLGCVTVYAESVEKT